MLMHKYIELKQIVRELEPDIEKLIYKYDYNTGTKIRWKMQEIKELCNDVRELIQVQREHERTKKQLKQNKDGK